MSDYQQAVLQAMVNARRYREGASADVDAPFWNGPGARETKRRVEKYHRLVDTAMQETSTDLAFDWIGVPTKKFKPKVAKRKMAPYEKEYKDRCQKACDMCYLVEDSRAPTEEQRALQKYLSPLLEDHVQTLFQDTKTLFQKLRLYGTGYAPNFLSFAMVYRSQSRFELAFHSTHEASDEVQHWYQGCVDDCHCGLALLGLWREPLDATAKTVQIYLLLTRGRALYGLGQLEESLRDLRAALAAIRLIGDAWQRHPSIGFATSELVQTMAAMKKNCPRPHFTGTELEKWQRELGLGLYGKDLYKCGYCGAQRSETVKLMQCSRCEKRWFCSQDCLDCAWKNGHKQECKDLRQTCHGGMMDQKGLKTFNDGIQKNGYFVMALPRTGFSIFMYEKDTGEIFESFSNARITLLPDEDKVIVIFGPLTADQTILSSLTV